MKKTAYLIIISIFTIGCIIFGTFYHTKNISFGSIRKIFNGGGINFHFSDDDWDISVDTDDDVGNSKEIKGSFSRAVENFSSIDIDANVMSLEIVEGSEFKIECSYNREYLKPTVEVKNGELRILQRMPKRTKGNNNAKAKIYIPSDASLDKIDIDLNVGEIKILNIEASKCDIDNNVGEVRLRNVDIDDIDVSTNVGEINISVDDNLDDYRIDVSTDVGAVKVDGQSYKRSYSSRGNGKKKLDAKSNVGEITIN